MNTWDRAFSWGLTVPPTTWPGKVDQLLTIAGRTDTATTDDDLAGRVSGDVYPDNTQVDRPSTARPTVLWVAPIGRHVWSCF